ncbi:hypothetical protein CHS0354_033375 [Potamilus streckersoni]|uniref:Succinate dehydrogenase assembly factor 3 n=1 Tax=Potamilus streckersoni TaxID=2493646 RepID=A0AAE0RU10_9BIVA|nr:hypothetical protein CHS0354_033375 [Potamilus streckersoni]
MNTVLMSLKPLCRSAQNFLGCYPQKIPLVLHRVQSTSSSEPTHKIRVQALYKALLKLHRGLPLAMKAIGDEYVKAEFRAHKNATHEQTEIFMEEWTKYYLTLARQLGTRKKQQTVGQAMSPELLDCFSEEQLGQLLELFKETVKPVTEKES